MGDDSGACLHVKPDTPPRKSRIEKATEVARLVREILALLIFLCAPFAPHVFP
ncbi:hypothetical protein ACWERI_38510 [Streptomyces collinus]